jgi:hypothetical protein
MMFQNIWKSYFKKITLNFLHDADVKQISISRDYSLNRTYDQMQIAVLSCSLPKSPFIKNVNSTIVFSGMLPHQTAAVALHWISL